MNYTVDKVNTNKKLKKKIIFEGYSMKPRLKTRKDFVEVEEIVIIEPSLKKKVLKTQFAVAFKRMVKLVMNTVDGDETSGDMKIAFSELERMKRILKDKYKRELSAREFSNMWRKVNMLEDELNAKIIEQEKMKQMLWHNMMVGSQELEEKKGRSR